MGIFIINTFFGVLWAELWFYVLGFVFKFCGSTYSSIITTKKKRKTENFN